MLQTLCKLGIAAACAAAAAGAPPAGAKHQASAANAELTVGIGDNGYSMFSSSRFRAMHPQAARQIVFWNVAVTRSKKYLNYTRTWIRAAESAGVKPMISFGASGDYIPTVAQYTAAIRAFIRDFPEVKLYTAWNEPDWNFRPKLANNPGLAAAYFNALVRYCHGCTIAAGDVYRDTNDGLASWVRAYKRGLHYRPKAWALHDYHDLRGHRTSQLRAFERATGSGQIWLTEISGVLRRGHWAFRNQGPQGANRDERFLFALPKRFHRITAIYHFQWQGTPPSANTGWDSGLIGPRGAPRPAYWTVKDAARGTLP